MPVIADWRSKRGGMMSGPHVVVELVEAVAARSAFETRLFSSVCNIAASACPAHALLPLSSSSLSPTKTTATAQMLGSLSIFPGL